MFNIKLEEKSNKMSFKVVSVKIQRSINRRGWGDVGRWADRVKILDGVHLFPFPQPDLHKEF